MSRLEFLALVEGVKKPDLVEMLHTLLLTGSPRIPFAGYLWDWSELREEWVKLKEEVEHASIS